jgi:thiol-disulfide isomerase/thioredoxin
MNLRYLPSLTTLFVALLLAIAFARPASAQDDSDYSFELDSFRGEGKLSFEDLAGSGQPFAITWWLTDCPLCRLSMPYVQKLHKRIGADKLPLRLVTINIDFHRQDVADYVEEHKVDFEILLDPRAKRTDDDFGVRDEGTPLTIVFNEKGEIIGKLTGFSSSYPEEVLKLAGLETAD